MSSFATGLSGRSFLRIMIPAMMPPPMPVKLFEFAAGVFEMKTVWFFLRDRLGKFLRFLVWALITIFIGPIDAYTVMRTLREHHALDAGSRGNAGGAAGLWVAA